MTTKQPPASKTITQAGKTYYLTNKELLAAVLESKQQGEMTEKLARMLTLLCSNFARRANFVNYSYNEDMQAYALLMLVRTWKSFDPAKSNNPFAYYTQSIKNSFKQYLNRESPHSILRDKLLIQQGLNPSYGYQDDTHDTNPIDSADVDPSSRGESEESYDNQPSEMTDADDDFPDSADYSNVHTHDADDSDISEDDIYEN